jgi:hypothetical protein
LELLEKKKKLAIEKEDFEEAKRHNELIKKIK